MEPVAAAATATGTGGCLGAAPGAPPGAAPAAPCAWPAPPSLPQAPSAAAKPMANRGATHVRRNRGVDLILEPTLSLWKPPAGTGITVGIDRAVPVEGKDSR